MSKIQIRQLLFIILGGNLAFSVLDCLYHLLGYGESNLWFYGLLGEPLRFMLFYMCVLLFYSIGQNESLVRVRYSSYSRFMIRVVVDQCSIFIVMFLSMALFNLISYKLLNHPEWVFINHLENTKLFLTYLVVFCSISFPLHGLTKNLLLSYLLLIPLFNISCEFTIFGQEIFTLNGLIHRAVYNDTKFGVILGGIVLFCIVVGDVIVKHKKQTIN